MTEKELAASLLSEIEKTVEGLGRTVRIMEVCGTHTVELRRQGIHGMLPEDITLISGPGCPVCVTPTGYIDNAISLARSGKALVASFGDMLRVPGSGGETLASLGSTGAVKLVYSPAELPALARAESRPVVFLGIGFETTIPTVISSLASALSSGVRNLLLYSAFKVVPPALHLLTESPERRIDGYLLPGHVSIILGPEPYGFLSEPGGIPGVITGFDGLDMLLGVLKLVRQVARGENRVENAYPRAVKPGGNPRARALMEEMLEPRDARWRGLGVIPDSGLFLRPALAEFDAEKVFGLPEVTDADDPRCLCPRVISGEAVPTECPLFGTRCTPDDPVGPCMVSAEGTCAAYLRYGGRRARSGKESR
jgi:hydrogenase expression/formation protein HypD